MMGDWLTSLGIILLFLVIVCIIIIPIIIGIVIATAVASWLGASGLLWWCIVLFVAFVIWGILSAL